MELVMELRDGRGGIGVGLEGCHQNKKKVFVAEDGEEFGDEFDGVSIFVMGMSARSRSWPWCGGDGRGGDGSVRSPLMKTCRINHYGHAAPASDQFDSTTIEAWCVHGMAYRSTASYGVI